LQAETKRQRGGRTGVFTPDERERIRARLLEMARSDEDVAAAALTGSASQDAEDRWSDIDLSFAVASGVDRDAPGAGCPMVVRAAVVPRSETRSALEKVGPEGVALDRGREVPIGSGDDPHVDLGRPGQADALELPLLEHPQ